MSVIESSPQYYVSNGNHAMPYAPLTRPIARKTWLVTGKIFTIHIHEEFETNEEAIKRLDVLAAAANDILEGDIAYHQGSDKTFYALNDEKNPTAIVGPARSSTNPDIRVSLYEPHIGPQIK